MRRIVTALSAFIALVLLLFIACNAVEELSYPLPDIQPRLENATVYPDNGTWDQTFNYTVNCSFFKKVNITLEVYNLSLLDWWEPAKNGTYTYDGTGERKTLTWSNIKICSDECAGTSRYRFKYNGSVLKDVNEKEIHDGPRIPFIPPTVKEEFKNATVTPPSGLWNDSFDYSVYVNMSEKADIRLEVFDTRNGAWNKSIGSKPYNKTNKWQKLTWSYLRPFSANCTGVARYRFVSESGKHESEVYYGPMLESVVPAVTIEKIIEKYYGGGGGGGGGWRRFLENPDDYPDEKSDFEKLVSKLRGEGIPYKRPELIKSWIIPETSWKESFDYYANVKHPDRAEMWLTLKVYSPGKNENITCGTREIKPWMYNKTTNITKIPVKWTGVKVFTKEDVIAAKAGKLPKCYICFYDGYNDYCKEGQAPNITNSPPTLTNPDVNPEEGRYEDEFKYKVKVMDEDSEGIYVTLHILNPEDEEIYNETKCATEDEAKRGEIIDWTYTEFTEAASKKTFKYYFNATDGIDSAATKKHKGPKIKFVPPVELKAHEVYPNSSGWWDEFLYTATIYNPTEDNVTITLEVHISSEGKPKKWHNVSRPGEHDLSWSVKPFNIRDFNNNSSYKFTVKGEPLNYEEREEFPGPRIEDIFGFKHWLWRG